MILTDADRSRVEQLLTACGIEGEEMETSLATLCKFSGDVTLPEFVSELRGMPVETTEETVQALAARFGNAAAKTALVIQKRMP